MCSMRYNKKRNETIYRLWVEDNLSYQQIAELEIYQHLSLEYIQNLIYDPRRVRTPFQKEIQHLFHVKFQELQNKNASIKWVYENQPSCRMPLRTIQQIIADENRRRSKFNEIQLISTKTICI